MTLGVRSSQSLLLEAERKRTRRLVTRDLESSHQHTNNQFLTPAPIARFMASLFDSQEGEIRCLDAGAGTGSLTAAFTERVLNDFVQPKCFAATAFEIDAAMVSDLRNVLNHCQIAVNARDISFSHKILSTDFIASGIQTFKGLFSEQSQRFTHAILNPPYGKMNHSDPRRMQLESIGLDGNNLYSAFLDIAIELLEDQGQLVAITPRSFFNGAYFLKFRQRFLERMSLRHIRVYDSRKELFGDDGVLQETVVFHAVKTAQKPLHVTISAALGSEEAALERSVPYAQVVKPDDKGSFIHIVKDGLDRTKADLMNGLTHTLEELGLQVSTGKVVDFRVREMLIDLPAIGDYPLIYPCHLERGTIRFPFVSSGKPNGLRNLPKSLTLTVPEGLYVLVKRFSSKEEPRRIVAALYDPALVKRGAVGFENHLNYIHLNNKGLPQDLALGLIAFLNSGVCDGYFRQFSGHTQVNATDLRQLPFPDAKTLKQLGQKVQLPLLSQMELDKLVNIEVFKMAEDNALTQIERKIKEATSILRHIGTLPRESINERSALVLLALLSLKPESAWNEVESPLMGVTPIMNFIAVHYGKRYAPNSRETIHKQTLHHLMRESIITLNSDDPTRTTNSPKSVYQVTEEFLATVANYENQTWQTAFDAFLNSIPTRKTRAESERQAQRIPVTFGGQQLALSSGGQNPLVKKIIEDFCSRFAAGAEAVYIGDTSSKTDTFYDRALLQTLGLTFDDHGKMPDVIVYQREKNWLFLIEAVTTHGAITETRLRQLETLFQKSRAPIVYVTAFESRTQMRKYLADIAWETEVWVADHPEHLIHFNGDKFIGPRLETQ